jgi:hypothetical protein
MIAALQAADLGAANTTGQKQVLNENARNRNKQQKEKIWPNKVSLLNQSIG